MIAAPFILGSSDAIVSRFVKSDWDMKALDLHSMLVETMSKSEHVLIIGFGRGGQTVGRVLAQENIPFFALDLDIGRVQVGTQCRRTGLVRRCQTARSLGGGRFGARQNGGHYPEQYARNPACSRQYHVLASEHACVCSGYQ